jgi:flagellar assembly protein FliH
VEKMLSSYKVIKSNSVVTNGNVEINTEIMTTATDDKKELGEKNAKNFIESYEVLARTMLENARRQSDKMIALAYEDARKLEQEAYEKGMSEGYNAGYEKGTEEAKIYYNDMVNKAQFDSQQLIDKADNLLLESNNQYIEYLKEKKEEVQELIVSIAENILKREVKDEDAITNMVLDAIEMVSKSKTVIVKSRSNYVEDLKVNIENWKHKTIFQGEVFVVTDDELEEGTAVIQRNNGKITININDAIEKVREIILLNS